MMETLYLGVATLSGTYIALVLGERLSLHFAGDHLTPYVTSYMSPLIAITILPFFLIARDRHFWLRNIRIHGTKQATIYPHRDRILGTDWIVDIGKALKDNRLLETWHSFFQTVGSTFWHQSVGVWEIMTNEPENLKVILGSGFNEWEIGGVRKKTTVLTLGPHAIFSVNGKEWESGRKLIRPSFMRNQVADLECQDRHVERLLARVPKDGTAVELQELFYLFTMDSATDFILGYCTNTLVNPTVETLEFLKAFDHSLFVSSSRGRLGWTAYLMPNAKFDESVRTMREYIDGYVAKAVANEKIRERPYIFLNEILASGASREHIRDQLLAIIIGGRDTSAGSMSSMFWVLARRPDIVAKLRDEIAELDGKKPTWEELKGMKYLNMVLKEVLRLYPPVPTNMRMAVKDTVLPKGGGPDGQSPLFVPKGTGVRWSLHSLQRRKDLFGEDAVEFRPERWENLRTTWEYLPFSGGPRTCIGQQFALTQMAYMLTRFLQTFEAVEPRDERDMVTRLSSTTSLANGCWVSLKPAEVL